MILRWQTGSTKLGSLFLTLPTRVLTERGRRHHHHRRAVEAGRGIVASLPPTANEWFDHTLYNRLSGKQLGSIVLIMHRLHEDDLTCEPFGALVGYLSFGVGVFWRCVRSASLG